jgi:recombination protein RecA
MSEKTPAKRPKGRDGFLAKHRNRLADPHDIKSTGSLATGSLKVDALLGGGLRRGKITVLYGAMQSGKSTLAIATASQVLRGGGSVLWFDFEGSLDLGEPGSENDSQGQTRGWLQKLGVDPYQQPFDIVPALYGEEMWTMIEDAIHADAYDLVVIDSIAAVAARRELAGDVGDSTYGSAAALNSSALRRIMAAYGESKNRRLTLLIINQVRDNVGSPYGGTKQAGGRALPHYASTICKVTKTGSRETAEEVVTLSRVQVDKSRFVPRRSVDITISSRCGVDVTAELLEYALRVGRAHKSGAWVYFYDRPVDFADLRKRKGTAPEKDPANGFVANVQGETAAKLWLEASGWTEALYAEALASVSTDEAEGPEPSFD